ncbi:hypothetical protein DAPPUDRAFT_117249 [Daphnia pulex]|uniref:Replication protein A OB domain-containing protein n=1 Tax=Daphnia pulex TaxID=6669 RepID=E9HS14_DAPPU|nr:hypothetical protein DAPPUDRAFT_117249 [Daphnia pulex]|eukprot:EFX65488.1 hypothetical protein DAPPUDRAFT_117249 [Daphnia pulex]
MRLFHAYKANHNLSVDYKAAKGDKQDRYRLFISDGKYSYAYGMLATQLNHLVVDGQLENFTIIKVKKFVNKVATKADDGKKEYKIILLYIEPLVPGSEVGEKIGNLQTLKDDGEVTEEAAEKPTITFNSVPFDQLPNLENDNVVDVIGLVLYSSEFVLGNHKTNEVSRYLTAKLVDSTNTEVKLSLSIKVEDQCIVALNGAKISNNFGGRYLETLSCNAVLKSVGVVAWSNIALSL